MADDITYSGSGATVPSNTKQVTDEHATRGHMPVVKIGYSADGSATLGQVDADGVLVNLGANNDVTVTGSVTANAGTNLNTSALATESTLDTRTGALTETAPATDTASSGLNGRLQRIAQRITSLIALIPASLGQKTKANSLAVTLASDQDALPVTDNSGSLTVDNGGTFAVQVDGSALTSLQLIDDAVYTDGTGTVTKGLAILGQDGTNPQAIKTDTSGELQVDVLTMPTVAVTQSGTWDEVGINDSGNSITVDNPTLSIAGGGVEASALRVTLANDSTGLVSVDDNGGSLTVDGTVTVGSITAGDNTVGRVKITDGTDVALVDGSGNLMVNVAAGGGTGGTSATDDAAFTAASGTYTPVGGIVTSDSVDSGDGGAFAMLANRQQKVTLYDSSGVELAVGGGTQYTEDAAAAANPVGNALILVREDARAGTLVSADGDNVAARGNNKGELYVKGTDTDALLTTIDADTGTIAGAVAGSEMQVDVVASLPAGTNAIGKLAANSGVDIGDVDITSIAAGDNNIGNVDIVTMPNVTVGTMANLTESLVDDAAFTPATSRVVPIGFTLDDTSPDTVNEGDIGAARMTSDRAVHTSIRDSAGNNRGANVNASNQLSVSVDNTVTVGSHAVTNAGTFAVQVDGSALTALQLIDNPVLVDDAAFTPAASSVNMAGFEADETSTDSVDEGDAGAARMTLDRKLIVNPQPHTAGGLSIFRSLDIDETEEDVKTSAGQVYGWWITNLATSTRYVKFYNATAANVTVGTTTPVMTLPIPGNSTDDIAANALGAHGIAFDTAICVAATTGLADNDTGAPSANDVVINIFYK